MKIKPMEPSPEILYKYRSLSVDNFKFTYYIFMKNELYFPHPDQVDDPFDCKTFPYLENVNKRQLLKKLETINPKKFADKEINLLKVKQAINNKSESELRAYFLDKFKSQQNVGVLSLSEKHLDILMWGHYTDSHKGICIGFDYNKLLFYFNDTLFPPDKVKYPPSNEYPKWDPFVDDKEELVEKIFFTKALCWKYEQEWRVILPEKGRSSQKFDPDAIVSVHLGCQITKGNKEAVIDWCLQRNRKPKIYETKVNESSYSIKEYEITY
jgi:hypothetical protein